MPDSDAPSLLHMSGLQVGLGVGALANRMPVLHDISLALAAGERVALLGRNGAGKTTLLRAILGLETAASGTLCWQGEPITRWPTYQRARRGIAYVPQGRGLYLNLSVEQNLRLATLARSVARPTAELVRAYAWFPTLYTRRLDPAGLLSGGVQQQLAVARALLSRPRLLLLDEPLEGIQPSIVQGLARTLADLSAQEGIAWLWVDQNLDVVLALCTRVIFMERGHLVHDTSPAALRLDPSPIERYLGT